MLTNNVKLNKTSHAYIFVFLFCHATYELYMYFHTSYTSEELSVCIELGHFANDTTPAGTKVYI